MGGPCSYEDYGPGSGMTRSGLGSVRPTFESPKFVDDGPPIPSIPKPAPTDYEKAAAKLTEEFANRAQRP